MTTIPLKCLLPVRTTEAEMRAYCEQFSLTLVSWSHNGHWIDIAVQESVTPEQQATIAAAMTTQIASSIVSVRAPGETFNLA